MECTECREIVSAALDNEASREELQAADRHLAGCAACRSFRDDLATDRSLLQQWSDELPGERAPRRGALVRQLAAAAAIVVAIGVGFAAGRSSSTTDVQPKPPVQNVADGSDVLLRQESTHYYPDSNEMHSTVVLVLDERDASRRTR